MKRVIVLFIVLFCGVTSLQAQFFGNKKINGNGKISNETRTTEDYESIEVLGSLDVELLRGKEGSIKIEAERNFLEYIKTNVKNNTLIIKVKKGYSLRPSIRKRIAITVPFEEISEVTLSGSGDVECTDAIKTNHFYVSVAGSGDVNLHLITEKTTASVAGSGDIKLHGKTNYLEASVAGSGDITAYELMTNTADVLVAGSGDIRLFVIESLDASVSGPGDISYKGNPMNVEKSTVGSGDITKR
jgi:hypothetical protein